MRNDFNAGDIAIATEDYFGQSDFGSSGLTFEAQRLTKDKEYEVHRAYETTIPCVVVITDEGELMGMAASHFKKKQ